MFNTALSLEKQRWGFVCFKVASCLSTLTVAAIGLAPVPAAEVTTMTTTVDATARSEKQPAELAVTAVAKLCTFTPKEYETGTVIERLKPYSHPQLYQQLKKQPELVVETIPKQDLHTWKHAGGVTTVTVRVTEEDHPKDTATSWARKVVCEQTRSGFDRTQAGVYAVVVTKKDQQWALSSMKLLSSTEL